MSSVLAWSTSTEEAAERAFDLRLILHFAAEEERIAQLWEAIPVEVAPGDVDFKWRYRATGEIVFQPDESLLGSY